MATRPSDPARPLLRILGVAFGIAASLGGAIGVGILRAPGIVAGHLPHSGWILAAWVAGGIYALLGVLCVIELATSVPKAGGWYAYTREAFGPFPAFFVGWGFWLSLATALSYGSIALAEYVGLLVPGFPLQGRTLALVIAVAFCAFQLAGLKPVSRFQEVAGFLKGLVFLALIGACLLWAPHGRGALPAEPAGGAPLGMAAVVIAIAAIIKTYDGWQAPSWFAEEDRNPTRNLPRSMITGILLIIVIYLGVNLALVATLSPAAIAESKLPVASAIEHIFGGLSGRVVTLIAIVNIIGLLNTLFLSAPRILFAMARDGLFFRRATNISASGVPIFGTVFTGVAAIIMLGKGSFEWIFELSTFLSVVCYTAGYAALFALRIRQPNLPRPRKVWGYPVVPGIVLAVSLAFLYGAAVEEPTSALGAMALLALSYPVYRLIKR